MPPSPATAEASITRTGPIAATVGRGTALAVSVLVLAGPLVAAILGRPIAVAAVLALAGIAAVVDQRSGRLPDPLVVLCAVASAVVVAGEGGGAVTAAAAGLLGLAGPLLVLHLVQPGAVGFGDVKLATALGPAVGVLDPRAGLVALGVASGLTALVGLLARRPALPFGPGLVVGATGAVVAGGWPWA